MPSYTARELERETGVDRRTIAYYVQEGLLPKVGRRGRRTRYPKLFRDRLLFIRRVREAEEEGDVSPVSLKDIRKVFERVPPALIAGVADGRIAVTPELVSEPSTAFRTPGMRQAVLRDRWVGEERPMSPVRSPPPPRAPRYSPGAPAEGEDPGEVLAEPTEADMVVREEPRSYVQREVDVPPVYSRMPESSYEQTRAYDDESELADELADALADAVGANTAEALLGPPTSSDVLVARGDRTLDISGQRWLWRDGGWEPVAASIHVTQRFDDDSARQRIGPVPTTVHPEAPFTLIDAWPSFERTPTDNVWRGGGND
jgi:DNA-binding transcriptional MerR regulator